MTTDYSAVQYTVEVYIDDETGNVIRETWLNAYGDVERPGGLPAQIEYCPDTGSVVGQAWYRNNKPHRDGGQPASLSFDAVTGQETFRAYWIDGKQHGPSGEPTMVYRAADGKLLQQVFMESGHRHRTDGPAFQEFDEVLGGLIAEEFWLNGQRVEPF